MSANQSTARLPKHHVNTALLGGFRTCLLVVCICFLWDSTMTQMFCFLWMETLGLHSQDGYGLMGPPWEQVMRLTYYLLSYPRA